MHFSSKLECVRIGKCQNRKVSESEKGQNWKVSEFFEDLRFCINEPNYA